MKAKNLFIILIVALFASCQDKITQEYKVLEPVYMSYDEFRSAVKNDEPKVIESPGKIYMWKNYILINQPSKGIHVIDNTDPASPKKIGFINIPGNVDMAVKDDILYADSYVDLVCLDISDISNIKEISRKKNVFNYALPVTTEQYPIDNVDQVKGVVVGYTTKKVEQDYYENHRNVDYPLIYTDNIGWAKESVNINSGGRTTTLTGNGGTSIGVGGSMARFTISKNALFVLDNSRLMVFDISSNDSVEKKKELYVVTDAETLFPVNDLLYIGSQTGMYIYDIKDVFNPSYISMYGHIRSCDPVVVEGNYAYVTLRSGTRCNSTTNSLEVIDISNVNNPELVKAYDMTNPYGLGIDSVTLFVCDGSDGLKVFDATDVRKITDNRIISYPDLDAFDVIPCNGLLLMIGNDGLYQFDYTDVKHIKYLSSIQVSNK